MNKLLKILIWILVGILVLALGLMAVSPKKMIINESMAMEAPPNMIFNMVNDFNKWNDWSPWAQLDPDAETSYSEKTEGVGAQFTWKGNEKVGAGTQTIEESVSGESIKLALEFDGWDGISYTTFKFVENNGKTKVSWDMDGSATPFVFRPFNLIGRPGLKKKYKEGLKNLKEIVEKRVREKEYNGYKINETELDERHFIMNRDIIDISNMQQFYAQNLGALFRKLQTAGIEMSGMPSGLFFSYDESKGKADMGASIPIAEAVDISGATSITIPGGRAIQIDYYGNYDNLRNAHNAISDYMKDYGLLNNYPIVEEYLTDPGEEKDPSKWLTKISYYISGS